MAVSIGQRLSPEHDPTSKHPLKHGEDIISLGAGADWRRRNTAKSWSAGPSSRPPTYTNTHPTVSCNLHRHLPPHAPSTPPNVPPAAPQKNPRTVSAIVSRRSLPLPSTAAPIMRRAGHAEESNFRNKMSLRRRLPDPKGPVEAGETRRRPARHVGCCGCSAGRRKIAVLGTGVLFISFGVR